MKFLNAVGQPDLDIYLFKFGYLVIFHFTFLQRLLHFRNNRRNKRTRLYHHVIMTVLIKSLDQIRTRICGVPHDTCPNPTLISTEQLFFFIINERVLDVRFRLSRRCTQQYFSRLLAFSRKYHWVLNTLKYDRFQIR